MYVRHQVDVSNPTVEARNSVRNYLYLFPLRDREQIDCGPCRIHELTDNKLFDQSSCLSGFFSPSDYTIRRPDYKSPYIASSLKYLKSLHGVLNTTPL